MAEKRRVLAVGAHPDDVEFGMAGTLILLRDAGFEPHIMTLCQGDCGSAEMDAEKTMRVRREESTKAAELIGATYHPGLVHDLEVHYHNSLTRLVCGRIRQINPYIMLIPSYNDYMEDHSESARVLVMAAFCKCMRNYPCLPPMDPVFGDTYIYHAQPHGLRDAMNRYHPPELFVRIDSVVDQKEAMLRCHESQKKWLDLSQAMDAYLTTMRELSGEVGRWANAAARSAKGRPPNVRRVNWKYAEGFQRHCHLGFAEKENDPLREILKRHVRVNPNYEKLLRRPT